MLSSCADAIAMIANISKHIRYVASTATYVKEQLKRHPESVMQATVCVHFINCFYSLTYMLDLK